MLSSRYAIWIAATLLVAAPAIATAQNAPRTVPGQLPPTDLPAGMGPQPAPAPGPTPAPQGARQSADKPAAPPSSMWRAEMSRENMSEAECNARADAAFKAEGITLEGGSDNFTVGRKGHHVVMLLCASAGAGKNVLINIIATGNGPGSRDWVNTMQKLMEQPGR